MANSSWVTNGPKGNKFLRANTKTIRFFRSFASVALGTRGSTRPESWICKQPWPASAAGRSWHRFGIAPNDAPVESVPSELLTERVRASLQTSARVALPDASLLTAPRSCANAGGSIVDFLPTFQIAMPHGGHEIAPLAAHDSG
jgi:hypothetical protein